MQLAAYIARFAAISSGSFGYVAPSKQWIGKTYEVIFSALWLNTTTGQKAWQFFVYILGETMIHRFILKFTNL